MHMPVYFAVLLCALLSENAWAAPPPTTRKTLDQPAAIQGYDCAKGYAWFFADGHLSRCTVAHETTFAEITIPAGSIIALLPDGRPDFVQMSHDAPVRDFVCQGGGLLGPGEGSVVSFYPSGKLKVCFLARDQEVEGIPCSKGGFVASLTGPDPGVQFYESGKVHSCRLTRDFAGLHAGAKFKQPQ
jgi:hypothetical protein